AKTIVADEQNWEKADRQCGELKCTLGSPLGGGRAVSQPADGPGEGTGFAKVRDPHPALRAALSQGERDDTAIIVYSSGTTGNPKGVEVTFDNLNDEYRGAIDLLSFN